jgi:hypothetical protein
MTIEDKDAVARSEHKGKTSYFCSLPGQFLLVSLDQVLLDQA